MNRRAFLSALGFAPVAGVALVLPVKAEASNPQKFQPKFRCPAVGLPRDLIINFEDGRYWFERSDSAAELAHFLGR